MGIESTDDLCPYQDALTCAKKNPDVCTFMDPEGTLDKMLGCVCKDCPGVGEMMNPDDDADICSFIPSVECALKSRSCTSPGVLDPEAQRIYLSQMEAMCPATPEPEPEP